jgi:Fe-S cluster assembly iron-binding protein IscA
MISITEKALDAVKASVKDKGDAPCVRIYIAGYG